MLPNDYHLDTDQGMILQPPVMPGRAFLQRSIMSANAINFFQKKTSIPEVEGERPIHDEPKRWGERQPKVGHQLTIPPRKRTVPESSSVNKLTDT